MSLGDMGKHQQPLPPLLLTSLSHPSTEQSFYNLLENRYHTTSIPVLRNKSALCSSYGWLVLLDQIPGSDSEGECCLWNLTTSEIIQLPVVENPWHYNKCSLSKPPTDPDCFVLFNHCSSVLQLFCRIGDTAYFDSNLANKGYILKAMISFKGMIYGVVRPREKQKYEFVTIHMGDDNEIQAKPLLIHGEHPWEVPQPILSWTLYNSAFLMESTCGNELLLVTKMASNMGGGVDFRIFRVDVGMMECEELDNLDGKTVFINYGGNGFCRSTCESFGGAIKTNSIYYTSQLCRVLYVHDLDDRSRIMSMPYEDADIAGNSYWVDLPMNFNLYDHVSS